MLRASHLTLVDEQHERTLVKDLSFLVTPGDKIAVIGEEGNGKSSLLKVLLGERPPHLAISGTIEKEGRVGYLEQDIRGRWGDDNVVDFLLAEHPGALVDMEDYNSLAKLPAILGEVHFPLGSYNTEKNLREFSGGELVKLGLAKLLLHSYDLLLLDEPSNDLDLESIGFLRGFLLQTRLPLLFVSHDVGLLSSVATGVIHLEQTIDKKEPISLFAHVTYPQYVEQRSRALAHQTQVGLKQRAQLEEKEEKWRHIYEQVKYDQDQCVRDPITGRLLKKKMKVLLSQRNHLEKEKENLTPIPEGDVLLKLKFQEGVAIPNGKRILEFEGPLLLGERTLVKEIHFELIGPEKVALVGTNGIGKSTLLRQLYERNKNRTDIQIGYMPQAYDEMMADDETPLSFLAETGDKDEETRNRQYLGSLLFTREEMAYPLASCSGGMKAKLFLLRLVLRKANVLLLDEPTRNLSPLSAPVIEGLLSAFPGAILAVSHDVTFLRAVFPKILQLTPEGIHLESEALFA